MLLFNKDQSSQDARITLNEINTGPIFNEYKIFFQFGLIF